MENPLGTEQTLFATPESTQALQDFIGLFNGGEAIAANTAMFMTWNLCVKLVNEAIEEASKES